MDIQNEPPPHALSPTLGAIAWVFLAIGMQSFGGGMSAWIRREVVQRRGWLEERQFVGGMALSQIAPGANGVNLAVFVGTTLRGAAGAGAAVAGMLIGPALLVLLIGAAFVRLRDVPGVESAMAGVGAAAIGLNVANGARLSRRNLRGVPPVVLVIAIAAAVGLFGAPLLAVLVAALPLSLLLARRS